MGRMNSPYTELNKRSEVFYGICMRTTRTAFYFFLLKYAKNFCFCIQFWKLRFWWIYMFWGSVNLKIIFLSVGSNMSVFHQHNSKTNYNRNFRFSILHLYHTSMLFKTLYENWTNNPCTGTRKTVWIDYTYRRNFLLVHFNILGQHIK